MDVGAEPSAPARDLAIPFVSERPRDNEPLKDLKIELCSAALDAEPSELVKDLANPLSGLPARPNEPARDLKTEILSAKPEARENELVTDLKKEDLPEKLEGMPIETLKPFAIALA